MKYLCLTLAIIFHIMSCNLLPKPVNDGDFKFYVSEIDLYVKTSKRVGEEFYVFFSKKKYTDSLNTQVDYVRCKIRDAILVVVFDPHNPDSIYYTYPYITEISKQNIDFVRLPEEKFYDRFYHQGINADPDTLRRPYQAIFIAPTSYRMIHQMDSSLSSQIVLKDGSL